jgi:hypothetical protein
VDALTVDMKTKLILIKTRSILEQVDRLLVDIREIPDPPAQDPSRWVHLVFPVAAGSHV